MRWGAIFHIFAFPFRIVLGPGDEEPGGVFTFQIKKLGWGVTFPWKPGMAGRFFTFPIKRGGAFAMFFTFTCAHEMEGWQWLRWGVAFPTFTFQIKGWKCVIFNIFTF